MQDSPSSTSRPATSSDRRSSPRSKWPSQMPRRRRAHEHTATPQNNGGAPGLLCTRSGPGAPPLFRLSPRHCDVVSSAPARQSVAQRPQSQPRRPRHRTPNHRHSSLWGLSRWGPATASWPLCPQTLGPPGQFGLTPRWGPSRRVPGQLGFASLPTWPRAPLGPLVAGTPGAGLSSLLLPVLAPQLLVGLAHRGARHLVDDIDFVGHLPIGEALTEGGDDVLP